jgi:hypothetical protein
MNLPHRDLIIWAIAIILVAGTLIVSPKDFTAAATIVLAFSTFILASDSRNNIQLSKNTVLGGHLIQEMQDLIKLLYTRRDEYEYLERVHIPYFEAEEDLREWQDRAEDFWRDIDANKYLAPNDLRHVIEEYIKANEEWYNNYKYVFNNIVLSLHMEDPEELKKILQLAPINKYHVEIPVIFDDRFKNLTKHTPSDVRLVGFPVIFDYRFKNLPQKSIKEERIKEINELIGQLNPESDFAKHVKNFLTLIHEDTVLEAKRSELRAKVIDRYAELESEIDKIEAYLK